MIPVLTPDEVREVDEAASEPVEVLIGRAGAAVAREALGMLGGAYGRTVVVVAGKGNNGADGRAAADRLGRRGVRCHVVDAADPPADLPLADLVVDAAYGTGLRDGWDAPTVVDTPVLAVDIVSGLDAVTGTACGRVLTADRTVTFQAMKPGHLLGEGPRLSGDVVVADIGLDVACATRLLVTADDVRAWWIARNGDAHKWGAAVALVAGSAEMPGAAILASSAAARAGASLVALSVPGSTDPAVQVSARPEVVQRFLPPAGFAGDALADIERFASLVVGPGLGRDDPVVEGAREGIRRAPVPVVVDGDGIHAISTDPAGAAGVIGDRTQPTVLTPHDGEFETLVGHRPGADRIDAARRAAHDLGATVLLKGPTTIVASPDGPTYLVDRGDERLATAGTGDVLSGVVAALLASGASAGRAAASAAWIHGEAARRLPRHGFLAGDLLDAIGPTLDSLIGVA